ncbi:MAG: Stringent starvation protein B [Rhizobiales bacterium 24-66-13]|nr:MAG: Stringent starvation protein B [Azorhizobium sp. 12-66-6]OYZ66151.1 MAG: Stringent starvation protein B [Rhizobiales bacterium 24-66-13]OZB02985.1 MAG: Stringent starvation protein B [Rhizobiales bacterium 39-66-18]HQS11034.1 ClpXP protease specificity-enhancing factor SspB [Xanthobacteraceae bacterium]
MSSVDHIRYDLLAQEALRGVVRRVLSDVARDGLPGDHHFYVSFDPRAPGVRLSQRMREKYPEEMTIVLQHQFWDLNVSEHAFEVGLSFGGIPERLLVPFSALKGFFDPSVSFGLQFELAGGEEIEAAGENAPAEAPTRLPGAGASVRPLRGAGSEPALATAKSGGNGGAKSGGNGEGEHGDGVLAMKSIAPDIASATSKVSAQDTSPDGGEDSGKSGKDAAKDDRPSGGAEVVRLDVFRKK